MTYRPTSWILTSLTLPMKITDGYDAFWDQVDIGGGVLVDRKNEFEYSISGIGDPTLMGYGNIMHLLQGDSSGPSDDNLSSVANPMVFLGFGISFPLAVDDEVDSERKTFDESKNLTGEPSDMAGIIPASFQLGVGVPALTFGVNYLQKIGDFQPSASLNYMIYLGANNAEYERADVVMLNLGTAYQILEFEDGRSLSTTATVNAVWTLDYDFDWREDVSLAGSQPVGTVAGTLGTWTFVSVKVAYDILKSLNADLGLTLPLTGPDSESENDFDWSINLALMYRF